MHVARWPYAYLTSYQNVVRPVHEPYNRKTIKATVYIQAVHCIMSLGEKKRAMNAVPSWYIGKH